MKRIIVIMIAVWLVAIGLMLFSHPLRARYWGWRLARAETEVLRDYYASRLAQRPQAALGVARGLLTHTDPDVRLLAVHVIDRADGDHAETFLLAGLKDREVRVRDAAALAVGRRRGADLVSRLTELATGDDDAVAAAAVYALQRDARPLAVDAMIRVLETTESLAVRVQAIESLGLLGVQRARPALTNRLSDRGNVTVMPANERGVWRALAAQPDRPELRRLAEPSGPGVTRKTVGDYAAEALRRIRRESAPASGPALRPAVTRPAV